MWSGRWNSPPRRSFNPGEGHTLPHVPCAAQDSFMLFMLLEVELCLYPEHNLGLAR